MIICGMDEVGRGPLAGPLIAAAVILNTKSEILRSKLKDSKKLRPDVRLEIYEELINSNIVFAVEEISVELINTHGIGWANREVFVRLKNKISADKYIADGNLKIDGIESIIKADGQIQEVMAASIIAKVTRDKYMNELHSTFPIYGWDTNAGYGTKTHLDALKLYGPCEHHRTKFIETALDLSSNPSPTLRRGESKGRGEIT